MKHLFKPDIKVMGQVDAIAERPLPTVEELANEPMIFSGDLGFTREHGGPLTRMILDELPMIGRPAGLNVVIDTRITMTMKGAYPSIPGWHGDDVPRAVEYAQPDLRAIDPRVQHYVCLLSNQPTGVSNTEFVTSPLEVDVDPSAVWKSVDEAVNSEIGIEPWAEKPIRITPINDADIVRFDQNTIHRAAPTHTPGWRLFFRLSVTHRQPQNQIRRQVQIYSPISEGW